jgi:hypothetical protein
MLVVILSHELARRHKRGYLPSEFNTFGKLYSYYYTETHSMREYYYFFRNQPEMVLGLLFHCFFVKFVDVVLIHNRSKIHCIQS